MSKTRFGSLDGIHQIKKHGNAQSILISAGIFIVIFILFLTAVARTSRGTIAEQKKMLESAIDKGIVQCYVTEGRYPESFEYLKDNYGITYEEDLFRVDYMAFGSNMKPNVTIITLQ